MSKLWSSATIVKYFAEASRNIFQKEGENIFKMKMLLVLSWSQKVYLNLWQSGNLSNSKVFSKYRLPERLYGHLLFFFEIKVNQYIEIRLLHERREEKAIFYTPSYSFWKTVICWVSVGQNFHPIKTLPLETIHFCSIRIQLRILAWTDSAILS